MRIVVTIGGSIIIKNHDYKMFKDYAEVLKQINQENDIFVVVGGGKTARDYINIARDLGVSESFCDDIGIDVTRLNAKLLIMALGNVAYPLVPKNFNQALQYSTAGKIIVMGGTEPGHSTDAVGAILAEFVKADLLINATSVDGLYDKDPSKYDEATKFDTITPSKMIEMFSDKDIKAGTYEFFDMTAIQMLKRSRIRTVIVNGNLPKNIIQAIDGNIGTTIIPD
ncbi:MAG: UMP kinase [Methanomicrobiales archaeon]